LVLNRYRNHLVAHRGYQRLYPENTLLSCQKAIDAGALNLETDILLSADLQPVLYHDPRLQRVSGRAGKLNDLSLQQLSAVPAYEPKRLGKDFINETVTPLSAFVELLRKQPQVTAYIEIKKEAIAFAGVTETFLALTHCLKGMANQCCLISFDYNFIAYARHQGWRRCGIVLNHWKDLDKADIQMIKPDTIFCKYQKIPKKARLGQIAAEIILYEIDDPQRALYWLDRGATKIETFDIGNMLKQMDACANLIDSKLHLKE